ncbi:hypothetical protein FOE78_14990 [Microlunatus elymi]|uniref:ATP synthase protein I n=1 Tax=Microlunatus elymi TaxID=2596828 RepID=A0A516Q0U7_9ACTN|nr:hypothetical protein [Microlunatus elymi]QDP97056.1 hypothetical protein FOE78_14990 [Microlunatus elymi]
MTTDSPSSRSRTGPSIHVVRARKLLFGGLAGGLGAAIICLIIFTVIDGTRGLGSAALGAGMVLFFYTVGQLVMVKFADAGARTLMAVSMASYTGRVVVLGLILMIFEKNRDAWNAIDANTIFISTIAVIVGWLVVEVMVFRKLRIGIYDTEYTGPAEEGNSDSDVSDVDPGPSAQELSVSGDWDPDHKAADRPQSKASPRREEGDG